MKASGTMLYAALSLLPLGGLRAAGLSRRRSVIHWQSVAIWHHGLRKVRGTLRIGAKGVGFQPAEGPALSWSFQDIRTFALRPHHLVLVSYENRKWHLPGTRSFHFDMRTAIPPQVAAQLARQVGKPSENGVPNPHAPAFASLAARHPTRGGGTNGVLRFRSTGIDYLTARGRGARSWRWADIETIARPDPYHFRVGGYREIFNFELKQPMSERLFDRLWCLVYARRLRGLSPRGGTQR